MIHPWLKQPRPIHLIKTWLSHKLETLLVPPPNILSFLPILLTLLFVSACQPQDSRPDPKTEPTNAQAYPRTLTTALGSATLDKAPQRIVSLGSGTEDIMIELGVMPIAIMAQRWAGDDEGYLPWFRAALTQRQLPLPPVIDVFPEFNPEDVVALRPDLILAPQSGLTQAQFDQLSLIAPVVGHPDQPWLTSPETHIRLVGEALGKEVEAQGLIDAMAARLHQYQQQLHSQDRLFVLLLGGGNSLSMATQNDPRVYTLIKLGLTLSPIIEHIPLAQVGYVHSLSLEHSDWLNQADLLIAHLLPEEEAKMIQQPLFQSLWAVQNGGYVSIRTRALSMALYTTTPLSQPWALAQLVPLLNQALSQLAQHPANPHHSSLPPLNH